MCSDEYRPLTDEEQEAEEVAADAYMERVADEHDRREAEEYERARPRIERELAEIAASPALLPAPWERAIEVREQYYPTDGYTAEAGPFRITLRPDFVDDEDGGWMTWQWEAIDTRIEPAFAGFASNGYTGDRTDIRAAARHAVECCREELDEAPEAGGALSALESALEQ